MAFEDEGYDADYLTVASENIKKAKTRLTRFTNRVLEDDPITMVEWIEYVRDYILSSARQDFILYLLKKIAEKQMTDAPLLSKKVKHYLIMLFNTEFQQAIRFKNVFYFLNASKNTFDIEYKNFYEDVTFTNFVIHNPAIVEVYGQRGMGKTDFATLLMDHFHELDPDGLVLTNIVFLDKPDYVINVFNDYELLLNFNTSANKYIFIDEAGLQFTNFNSYASYENKFIHQFLPLSRKFQSKLFFIYQIDRYTNKSLTEFTDIVVHKASKSTVKIIMNANQGRRTVLHYETDPSPLKFDTNAIAYFDTFINLKALYASLSNVPYSEAKKKLIGVLKDKQSVLAFVHKKKQHEFTEQFLAGVGVEKEMRFVCKICGYAAETERGLKVHMTRRHGLG